jgi:ankyrin repeat protein
MVDQHPEAAQDSNLFMLAASHRKLEVVRYIHGLNPQAATMLNGRGNTCLHRACDHLNRLEVLEYLLDLHPAAIGISNNAGDLPLHVACRHCGLPEDILRLLITRKPEATKVKNNDGHTPLALVYANARYSTVATSCNRSIFSMLIDVYPRAVRELDNDGRLPLHHACASGICVKEIKALVKLYPPSISVVSPKHGLPIHLAAAPYSDGLATVEYLQELAPDSLDMHIAETGLPLHCAARPKPYFFRTEDDIFPYLLLATYKNRGTDSVFYALLRDRDILDNKTLIADRCMQSISTNETIMADRDSMGCAPLHIAVSTNLDTSFIQTLIEKDPSAVQLRDKSNSVPLHCAFRHGDPSNAADLLLDEYPAAVQIADVNHFLPLHVACRHGATLDIVKRLVEMNNASITARDKMGELPIHKACRGGHLSLVEFRAEKHASTVRVPSSNGTLPVFILCQSSGKKRGELLDENAVLGAIWQLLRKHPEAIISTGGGNTSRDSNIGYYSAKTAACGSKRIRLS